jgi:hypothetical protein
MLIWRRIVLNNSIAARTYGSLSTSFSRLERDARRRGAFFLYWNSNAFAPKYRKMIVDFRWMVCLIKRLIYQQMERKRNE